MVFTLRVGRRCSGVLTAVVAVVIDVGSDWLSDIKMGICPSAFWLNQNFCCFTERCVYRTRDM
jgi:chloride channel 3/4/5